MSRAPVSKLASGLLLALMIAGGRSASSSGKPIRPATLRWSKDLPGASVTASSDGRYVYALRSGDKDIAIAVDSQEPEKSRRRHASVFSVHVQIGNLGQRYWKVSLEGVSLEFVKHFHVIQPALDPADLAQQLQESADELDHRAALAKSDPSAKGHLDEPFVRAYQKETSEFIEFLSKNSLRETVLDGGNQEVEGWVYFSTKSKWLAKWKPQEAFIFRLPLDGVIYEFPFSLPPKQGEMVLRQRP